MTIQMLKGKIHRATVTDASLDYEGSMSIDEVFMKEVGILPYEKILVGNIANGNRFETYAIPAPPGSKTICLNGATAHLGKKGDLLVIMTFCHVVASEAHKWIPRKIVLSTGNTILGVPSADRPDLARDTGCL